MAPYGGPIEPGVAVGGFPKPEPGWYSYRSLISFNSSNRSTFLTVAGEAPDYRLATGLIITFLANNHQNKTLLEPALEWELK